MGCFNHDLFEALFYPCLQGSYVQEEGPPAQTAGFDCEPCHMPMSWTLLILDIQSFQIHRLVSSPGSIRC